MKGAVEISDFFEYMKQEGLVIVKKEVIENSLKPNPNQEPNISKIRNRLKRKKALKLSEIVDGNFFGVTTKKGVHHVVKTYLSEAEYFRSGDSPRAPILVLTSAVIRISKLKGIIYE